MTYSDQHQPEGSGAQDLVGYHIDLSDPGGTAVVTLTVEAKHLNRNGTLQGGIQAMVLDAAAGFTASRHLAGMAPMIVPVVTLSLTNNYVAPALEGQTLTARGRINGGGRKVVFASADITNENGDLVAQGNGIFKRTVL